MIRAAIARLRRWFRIMALRADIAGYEDDLATIWMMGQQGGVAHRMIAAQLDEARHQLHLCTRSAQASITN